METINRLNHYGFDQSIYDDCRAMIGKTNQKHAKIINIWFMLINLFYFVCAWLQILNVDATRKAFFLAFIIAPILIYFQAVEKGGLHPKIARIATFLDIAMFELYSILSSNAEPYTVSWIFLILMVIVALTFIETMARMTMILLVNSLLFCKISYMNKPASIASMDLANTIVVVSLALILHFAFQRARISQFATTLHDIKTQRELEISSSFDNLTSLFNRGKFNSMAETVLREKADEYIALVILDLDGFKEINDQLGHQTGDRAIQLAAKTILDSLKVDLSEKWLLQEKILVEKQAFAGRLGGDEFIIFMRGYTDREAVLKALYEIMDRLHGVNEGDLHGLRASVGMTEFLPDEKSLEKAYKRADDALYVSKRNGKDQVNINCV